MVGSKFISFFGNKGNNVDDDYDYDEYDAEDGDYEDDPDDFEDVRKPSVSVMPGGNKPAVISKPVASRSSVPARRPAPANFPMDICVIKPTNTDEAREITDTLRNNRCIILNLEGLDMDIAQRIIDIIVGSCFAIDGNLQKISNCIFLITPKGVSVSGDVQGSGTGSGSGIHIPDSNY